MKRNRIVRTMGKVVGYVDGDVFYTDRERKAHLYRKLNAWGISASVFEQNDFSRIVVTEYEGSFKTGVTYEMGRDDFLAKAETVHFRSHGLQFYLPLDEWEVRK